MRACSSFVVWSRLDYCVVVLWPVRCQKVAEPFWGLEWDRARNAPDRNASATRKCNLGPNDHAFLRSFLFRSQKKTVPMGSLHVKDRAGPAMGRTAVDRHWITHLRVSVYLLVVCSHRHVALFFWPPFVSFYQGVYFLVYDYGLPRVGQRRKRQWPHLVVLEPREGKKGPRHKPRTHSSRRVFIQKKRGCDKLQNASGSSSFFLACFRMRKRMAKGKTQGRKPKTAHGGPNYVSLAFLSCLNASEGKKAWSGGVGYRLGAKEFGP